MFIRTIDDEFWNLEQAQCIYANEEGEIKLVYPEGKIVVLQRYKEWSIAHQVLWEIMRSKRDGAVVFNMPKK